jgi:hypothetical protein
MSLFLRDRVARLTVLAALPLLAGACVKQDAPGVAIRPLNADIVFGVTPIAEEQAAPANFSPAAADTIDTSTAALRDAPPDLPPQDFAPPALKQVPDFGFSAPKKPVQVDCPAAAVDEFPDESAPLNVPAGRLPEAGNYRWKRSGQLTTTNGATTELTGFEARKIQNVTPLAADPTDAKRIRFTYETVQPEIGSDAEVVTTYQVDTAAPSREVNSPVSGDRVSGGDPERGLVLKSIRRQDASGAALPGGFSPVTGLLLVPLPIRQGEAFTSVSVDPATQQVYRYEATVVQRDRADACGEILDGWRVDGTLTVTGDNGGERKLSIIASPQFGMRIINESIEGALGDATFKAVFTVGQRVPSPT